MHQLNLPDQVYEEAARKAKEAGFESVEDYFAELVHYGDCRYDPDNLDHRFTPKVLEHWMKQPPVLTLVKG